MKKSERINQNYCESVNFLGNGSWRDRLDTTFLNRRTSLRQL